MKEPGGAPVFSVTEFSLDGSPVLEPKVLAGPGPGKATVLDFQAFSVHVEDDAVVLVLRPDFLDILQRADRSQNADRTVAGYTTEAQAKALRNSLKTVPKRGTPEEIARGEAHCERVIEAEASTIKAEVRVAPEGGSP